MATRRYTDPNKWPRDHHPEHVEAAKLGWRRRRSKVAKPAPAKKAGFGASAKANHTLKNYWGNTSSAHAQGMRATLREAEAQTREKEAEKARKLEADARKRQRALEEKYLPKQTEWNDHVISMEKKRAQASHNASKREEDKRRWQRRDSRYNRLGKVSGDYKGWEKEQEYNIRRLAELESKVEARQYDADEYREYKYYSNAVYSTGHKLTEANKKVREVLTGNINQLNDEILALRQEYKESKHAGQKKSIESNAGYLQKELDEYKAILAEMPKGR